MPDKMLMSPNSNLDPKNPKMIDRINYVARFWGFTALVALPVIIMVFLAYANPFWFRDRMMQLAKDVIYRLGWIRSDLVAPIVLKYKKYKV